VSSNFVIWECESDGVASLQDITGFEYTHTKAIFIRKELANGLSAGGFTGLKWLEITNYPGN
jgi:hypothetical protein